MKLSIILPTYNQEAHLGKCLNSLLDQKMRHDQYEIIVVNDGSTDDTLKIAQWYAEEYPLIRVVDQKNAGAGAARNTGLDHATGEYLHFVDPDDYVTTNCYPHLFEIAKKTKAEILCFEHQKTKVRNHFTPQADHASSEHSFTAYSGKSFIARHKYHNEVWWYLINREFLISTGIRFIEGKWMEDVILTPTLFVATNNLIHCSLDVYRHVLTANSAMTSKEPSHYNKLIRDIEDATYVFDQLINEIRENDAISQHCKKRIKTKQQSLVFFMLVRLMKSNLPVRSIRSKLKGFKKINAYPLNNFLGQDFNGSGYYVLTQVFNREYLISPFMYAFRFFYKPAIRIYSLF